MAGFPPAPHWSHPSGRRGAARAPAPGAEPGSPKTWGRAGVTQNVGRSWGHPKPRGHNYLHKGSIARGMLAGGMLAQGELAQGVLAQGVLTLGVLARGLGCLKQSRPRCQDRQRGQPLPAPPSQLLPGRLMGTQQWPQ